jgi:hypothetical protein
MDSKNTKWTVLNDCLPKFGDPYNSYLQHQPRPRPSQVHPKPPKKCSTKVISKSPPPRLQAEVHPYFTMYLSSLPPAEPQLGLSRKKVKNLPNLKTAWASNHAAQYKYLRLARAGKGAAPAVVEDACSRRRRRFPQSGSRETRGRSPEPRRRLPFVSMREPKPEMRTSPHFPTGKQRKRAREKSPSFGSSALPEPVRICLDPPSIPMQTTCTVSASNSHIACPVRLVSCPAPSLLQGR